MANNNPIATLTTRVQISKQQAFEDFVKVYKDIQKEVDKDAIVYTLKADKSSLKDLLKQLKDANFEIGTDIVLNTKSNDLQSIIEELFSKATSNADLGLADRIKKELDDVESDIAKKRKRLDELSKAKSSSSDKKRTSSEVMDEIDKTVAYLKKSSTTEKAAERAAKYLMDLYAYMDKIGEKFPKKEEGIYRTIKENYKDFVPGYKGNADNAFNRGKTSANTDKIIKEQKQLLDSIQSLEDKRQELLDQLQSNTSSTVPISENEISAIEEESRALDTLIDKIEYLKKIKSEAKFMETAEEKLSDMEDKAWDAGGNNPKSEAESLKKIKAYEDLSEHIDKARNELDEFDETYEKVIVTLKNGEQIEIFDSSDLEELSLAKNKIQDIQFVTEELTSTISSGKKAFDKLEEIETWSRKNVNAQLTPPVVDYIDTVEEIEQAIDKIKEFKNQLIDIKNTDDGTISSARQDEIIRTIAWLDRLVQTEEKQIELKKRLNSQYDNQTPLSKSSPTQVFDNEIQQNLVMLENYKNTIAEIDRLKLEPETDKAKHKIEELNKLADYFASKITTIQSENGHEVNRSMMQFMGTWNENLRNYYTEDQRKEFWKIAGERSGLNRDTVVTMFSGITEELEKIEEKSNKLASVYAKDITESRNYVSRLRADLINLVETQEELAVTSPKSKDYALYTKDIEYFSKRSPEVLQFLDKLKTYEQASDFVKTDEWLDFLATLPKAHDYLESIGYDFEKINQRTNKSLASTEVSRNVEQTVNSFEELAKSYSDNASVQSAAKAQITALKEEKEQAEATAKAEDEVNKSRNTTVSSDLSKNIRTDENAIANELRIYEQFKNVLDTITEKINNKIASEREEYQTVTTEVPQEVAEFERLNQKIQDIILSIASKISMVRQERSEVENAVQLELQALQQLVNQPDINIKIHAETVDLVKEIKDALANEKFDITLNPDIQLQSGGTTPPPSSTSGETFGDIQKEQQRLTELHGVLHAIIDLVNEKTSAFENEANMVGAVANREEQSLQKVTDALKTIKESIESISTVFANLKLGNEINTAWVSDILKLLKLDGKDFTSIHESLSKLSEALGKLKVKDNSFVQYLNNILDRSKELDNLAKILTQSSQKIKDAEEATKSKEEKEHSANIHKSYEKELQLNKELLELRHKIAMEDAKGNTDKSEELKVRNLSKMRQLEKDIAEIKKRSRNDTDKDERKRIDSVISELKKQYKIEEEGERKATYLKEKRKAQAAEEKARIDDEIAAKKKQEAELEKEKKVRDALSKSIDEYLGKLDKVINDNNIQKRTGAGVSSNLASRWESLKKDLNNIKNDLSNIKVNADTTKAQEAFDDLKVKIDRALSSKEKKYEKVIPEEVITNLGAQIEDFGAKNTRLTKELSERLEEVRRRYKALLDSGVQGDALERELKSISSELNKIKAEANEAGVAGKNFGHMMLDSLKSANARFIANYLSIQDMIRYARTAFETIHQLDTALVDLKKTTTMSNSELEDFYHNSSRIAKQMGVSSEEIISQASAWSRLGYSSKEAAESMAELSSQFAKISPGTSVEDATDYLVSTMKAFNIDVTNVESDIMDSINRIGNTMATSNQEVGEMLKRSSAAMAAANNSLAETIALESAAVQITRNAETTGTAFRTISMRIRGYDEETEELLDDYEELKGAIADLTKTAKTPGGISLFTDESKTEFKSTYQLLKEIAEIYHDLTDKQQAQLLEKLAG